VEFTIRSFGTLTAGLRRLKVGEHVYLDGPWGRFRVNPDPRVRIAMIAAGIGVTPMLSMLKTMADGGDRRECVLILGNRSETTIPGRADIEALQATLNLRVVHVLAASLPGPHEQWQFFLCGPSATMDAAESWLAGDGVAAEQFHSERFMMA
jgi:ferredoxin-NADP reductase